MQNLIKKLDKSLKLLESKPLVDADERMQFRVALVTVLQCIKLFPSSFKTIVANRSGGVGSKKDTVTTLLENTIKVFMGKGGSDESIVNTALQVLCLLFKSKDKSKL